MTASEPSLHGLGDARLAVHAASHLPAWLWTPDGTRILWANATGARLFGALRLADLGTRTFGAADPHRRQIAQLAGRLRADAPVRLERLRGFGAPLGRLATCACSRMTLTGGGDAVLVVAMEASGRVLPLRDRLKRLVEDADIPLAAFDSDGIFVGANDAARALLAFRDLSEAGLDAARDDALKSGRTETPVGLGQLVLQRVGSGADVGLIALLDPASGPLTATPPAAAPEMPEPDAADHEFSEFLFVDEFDDETGLEPPPHLNAPDIDAAERATAHDEPEPIRDLPPEDMMPPRTEPLRFLWEIDAAGNFRINSNELPYLIGEQAAASLDAPWKDVASAYASYGRMAAAIASEAAWSGVPLSLPTDNWEEPLTADLSGIPTYADAEFAGYRGFGVIYDLTALTRLETAREREARGFAPQSLSAHSPSAPLGDLFDTPPQFAVELVMNASAPPADIDPPVNVVPLRPTAEGWSSALTPGESNAFNELARELSARLEAEQMAVPASAPRPVEPEENQPYDDGAGAGALLDLAPVPMAVHRGSRLLYANAAFIAERGFPSLAALQAAPFDAGSVADATSTSLDWEGERARALVVTPQPHAAPAPSPAPDHAEDFGAILDAAEEAILMFDSDGAIRAGNRSAARLFAIHGDALLSTDIASLFTADTQVGIAPLLELLNEAGGEQAMEARSIVGGREVPLRVAFGRARPDSANFYAIVRDLTALKKSESELAQARRQTERAASDKADILARISHEMRSPLSAIIGFADVMIEQRFGALGNDRYADYLRDIRGCGERVVAIVDDLLDLSRIESGKRDLVPAPLDLNDLVEQCVAAMQPQANRERIIIRSSLAHPLPRIFADGAALRQIALNLIDNSIHLANPGGQVIVSTVRTDSGDVLLRVRDTGHGLNDNEVANALAPFRASDEEATPAQIRLSLTRALAEANQGRFSVKPAPYAGTLIEVAFSPAQAG